MLEDLQEGESSQEHTSNLSTSSSFFFLAPMGTRRDLRRFRISVTVSLFSSLLCRSLSSSLFCAHSKGQRSSPMQFEACGLLQSKARRKLLLTAEGVHLMSYQLQTALAAWPLHLQGRLTGMEERNTGFQHRPSYMAE